MKTYTLLASFFLCLQFAAAQPSEDGLILWLPFNGNANDESNNNHSASAYGATLTEDRHGNPNAAYAFDGIDDYMLVPDHPDLRLGNTSFTISTWVRPDVIDDSQSHTVISKRTGAGNNGYLFQLIGTNHIMGLKPGAFDIVTSGGWDDPKITTEASLAPSHWHHVLYCYDSEAKQGQFFIDNVPDVVGPMIDANGNANGDFYIGKDKLTDGNQYPDIEPGYIGGFYFNGAIDDIRIYNKKLNRQEIAVLFDENESSLSQTEDNYTFKLFPDPVAHHLNVETNYPDLSYVLIHDSNGRLFIKANFSNQIDCRQLPAGSFVVSFFDKNNHLARVEQMLKQ